MGCDGASRECDDGKTQSSRERDAASSSTEPKEPPKKVVFDHHGLPVGSGSGKPSTSLGSLTRSKISVKFASWDIVPEKTKDLLWTNFKEKFRFRDSQRAQQMIRAAMAWRRYKNKLRRRLKPGGSLQNWLDAILPKFVPEDWRAFCVYEASPAAKAVREQNKRNRNYSAKRGTYTSGRDGYNRAAHKFQETHGRKATRIELWLYTHRKKNGGYAPHDEILARKFEEFLQLIEQTNDVEPIDGKRVAAAFGKATEKRTRCLGSTISNSKFMASAFAREMLEEVESEKDAWKVRLENIEVTNARLALKVDELIEGIRIGKFKDCTTQDTPMNTLGNPGPSKSFHSSTLCKILDWANVVAKGTMDPCGTVEVVHGHKLKPTEARVLIDEIIEPECPVWDKRQGGATTLSDIGVGGYMYWDERYLVPDDD